MSKIEAGRFELSPEPFNAAEAVETCVRLMKQKADLQNLSIDAHMAPGTTVMADKRAVKQILLNLLSNAIKFTPRGGRITVSTARQDDSVLLSVADTGVGIPAADLPRLGKPFEQATMDSSLAKAGTGLGLALVRSLAQLHGGDLTIDSAEGRGTTVTVLLPATQLAAVAA